MAQKRIERCKEKWYSFYRVYCKSGFIDLCQCNSSQNPNEEKKNYNLNSGVSFFRLNNGIWENARLFSRGAWMIFRSGDEHMEAEQLYKNHRVNSNVG